MKYLTNLPSIYLPIFFSIFFCGCTHFDNGTPGEILNKPGSNKVINKQRIVSDGCTNENYIKAYQFHDNYQYDSAFFYYNKAAGIYERLEDWPCMALNLYLAGETKTLHNPDEAEKLLKRAIDIINSYMPNRFDSKLHTYNRLGQLYLLTGYPDKALVNFKKSEQLLDSLFIENTEMPAYIINSIGDIYRYYFINIEEAEKYYRKAESLICADSVPHYQYLATIYYNLGALYFMKEDYNRSRAFVDKSIGYLEKLQIENRYLLEPCFNLLGQLEYKTGNIEMMEKNLLLSVKYNQQYTNYVPNLAATYNLLADIFSEIQNYEKALFYLRKTWGIVNGTNPIYSYHYANSVLIYARILKKTNNPEKALVELSRALELANKIQDIDPLLCSHIYNMMGEIFISQLQYNKAIYCFKRSIWAGYYGPENKNIILPPVSNILNSSKTAEMAAAIGSVYLQRFKATINKSFKDLDSALMFYLFADSLITNRRMDMLDRASKLAFLEKSGKMYDNAIQAIFLNDKTDVITRNSLALHFIERNKSVITMEMLQKRNWQNSNPVTSQIDISERNVLSQLSFSKKTLVNEYNKPAPDKKLIEYYTTHINQLHFALDSINQKYLRDYPSLYCFHFAGKPPLIDEIKSKISKNQLVVEYFWGFSEVYAFCITKYDEKFIKIGATDSINKIIRTFCSYFASIDSLYLKSNNANDYQSVAFELYCLLLKPAFDINIKNVKHITIIPDGPINDIPFEALVNSINPGLNDFSSIDYLLHNYNFNYQFNVSLLLNSKKHKTKKPGDILLSFYSPEINESLPAQEFEKYITNSVFNTSFIEGKSANTSSFISGSPHADIIHIAAHGKIVASSDNEAVLLLYPDSSNKSGHLTIDDITSLQLNASLVFLASCNTGYGKYYYSDGINNISRAFIGAGCDAVIVSAQKVPDNMVANISSVFYKELSRGKIASFALSQAKKEYLKKSDNILSHPAYWANIRLWGNDFNVADKSNYYFLYIVAFVGLLILLKRKISKPDHLNN